MAGPAWAANAPQPDCRGTHRRRPGAVFVLLSGAMKTARHQRCQPRTVTGCRDGDAGPCTATTTQGPLPEICQKLRYT